jgi:glycosyltransferase involved in cell wall biosynthesis
MIIKNVIIIIPVFNVEETIEKTLSSLLHQSYKKYHIVISENHSTDRTREIIDKYVPIIKIISPRSHMLAEEHGNFCLEYAENIKDVDYIALFHGDDIYDQEMIINQVEFLDQNKDAPLVFTDAIIVDENYTQIGWVKNRKKSKNISKYTLEEVLYGMLSSTITCLCPTVMIRAEILQGSKSYRFRPHLFGKASDYGLWLEIIDDYNCVGIVHKDLVKYRKSTTSDSAGVYYSIDESPGFKTINFYIANKDNYQYKNWRWGAHIERLRVQDYVRRLRNEVCNGIMVSELFEPVVSLRLIFISVSSLSGVFYFANLLVIKLIFFITPPGNTRLILFRSMLNNSQIVIFSRKFRIRFKYNLKKADSSTKCNVDQLQEGG